MRTDLTWFRKFAGRHIGRIRRADWPPATADFWDTWRRAFVKHGITETAAEKASEALAENPPKFLDHQLADLLSKAKAILASEPQVVHVSRTDDQSSREFNSGAQSLWDQQTEFAQDYWRALAVARMPFLGGAGRTLDLVAMAWCYEPAGIVGGPARRAGDPDDGSEIPDEAPPAPALPLSKGQIQRLAKEGRTAELRAAMPQAATPTPSP